MSADKVHRFDIEGQQVLCHVTDGDRLWVCDCEYFKRTLTKIKEGFCPHTAIAMMKAMDEGIFEFDDLDDSNDPEVPPEVPPKGLS